ncbi:MAG: glycosyltransferase family 4 protein [Fimbriimonadaceae bacterium]|nr:glycosyltransferase family 4 protein [Fimbriimonadaceae bacterium]
MGAFVRSHVEAASKFVKCSVIHLTVRKGEATSPPTIRVEKTVVHSQMVEYRVTVDTPIRRFGLHDTFARRAFREVINLVIREQGPFSLYHIHVRDHLTKMVPFIRSLKNKPFLLTEHWSFYHRGIHGLGPAMEERQRMEIKKWLGLPTLYQILPVSRDLAATLISGFGATEESITVIPNVADPTFSRENSKTPSEGADLRLVMTARWEPPKNPGLFFDALRILEPEERMRLHIDLIGAGSLETEMRRRAREIETGSITFHGLQSKPFIGDKLNRAHFLVHPTNAENLPAIIIESLCCGTPVLSHRVNGIPELLDETNGIMCPARDTQAFAMALRGILNGARPFDREAIARNAQERFSQRAVGERIFGLYQRAAASK